MFYLIIANEYFSAVLAVPVVYGRNFILPTDLLTYITSKFFTIKDNRFWYKAVMH